MLIFAQIRSYNLKWVLPELFCRGGKKLIPNASKLRLKKSMTSYAITCVNLRRLTEVAV